MAKPDYTVLTLDLAAARDKFQVVDTGKGYDGVVVLGITGASIVSLAFYATGQNVPVTVGDSYETEADKDGCRVPPDEGLFVTNTAAAGTLTLLVSFSGLARVA